MAGVRCHRPAPKVISEHPAEWRVWSHIGIVFNGKNIVVDELAGKGVDVAQQRRYHSGDVVHGIRVPLADADVLFPEQIVVVFARDATSELLRERQSRGTATATPLRHFARASRAWRSVVASCCSRRQRCSCKKYRRETTSPVAACLLRPLSRPLHRGRTARA